MTCDLEAIRRMVQSCNGDGRLLLRYDPATLLFVIRQMMREIDILRMELEAAP